MPIPFILISSTPFLSLLFLTHFSSVSFPHFPFYFPPSYRFFSLISPEFSLLSHTNPLPPPPSLSFPPIPCLLSPPFLVHTPPIPSLTSPYSLYHLRYIYPSRLPFFPIPNPPDLSTNPFLTPTCNCFFSSFSPFLPSHILSQDL